MRTSTWADRLKSVVLNQNWKSLSLALSTFFCIPLYLGFGLLRPEEAVFDVLVGYSSNPAERWNLESLFTTRVEVWVRTPICPPYGVIGKMCDVPLSVETATHLKEKKS